jgi:hypothetical protein
MPKRASDAPTEHEQRNSSNQDRLDKDSSERVAPVGRRLRVNVGRIVEQREGSDHRVAVKQRQSDHVDSSRWGFNKSSFGGCLSSTKRR